MAIEPSGTQVLGDSMSSAASRHREFPFDSAHRLPNLPPEHKCTRLHGHTYRVVVTVTGPVDPELGWVMDFGDIKDAWRPIDAELDHHYLNDIDGLENPTSENLAVWIWDRLLPTLPQLSSIEIRETCTSGCIYTGEHG